MIGMGLSLAAGSCTPCFVSSSGKLMIIITSTVKFS